MSMQTRSMRSPAARDRRMSPRVSSVLTALGDGAPARQQGIRQFADALLARLAHRQVADQPSHHRCHPVAAGIETADVVGECDLGIAGHFTIIHNFLR